MYIVFCLLWDYDVRIVFVYLFISRVYRAHLYTVFDHFFILIGVTLNALDYILT